MLLFTILMFLTPYWALAQNYCSISRDHTMCKYQGSGPTCGSDKESGVSKAEIQQILKLHNDFRSKIALGREYRGFPGPQPSAANMQALVWDDNLAAVAQKWADQCTFQHDACRNDPRFKVGQNMYFSSGFTKVDWTRAVSAWYEEVARFNSRIVNSFQFQPMTGHYTQLVWANTRHIGCGRTTYGGSYRLQDYQRIEYILSSTSGNESLIVDENTKRRTDILPDPEDIPTKTLESVKLLKEQTTKSYATNQTAEKNNLQQIITENVNPVTSENKEIHQSTKSQVSVHINSEQSTAENSIEKIEQEIKGTKEIRPNQSITNQSPTFSIYFPGNWISKSQPSLNGLNGQIAGTFQSLDFSGTADLNQIIQETPSNGALKITSWESLREHWNFNFNSGPLNFGAEQPSGIGVNRLTKKGWVPSTYENLGRDQILVCNYGPTGNYFYQPVYVRGQPCSRCPLGSACITGLCV